MHFCNNVKEAVNAFQFWGSRWLQNIIEEILAKKNLKNSENMNKYYYLKQGEIIQEGDEVEVSSNYNDPAKWIKTTNCIGEPAPDPNYISHRKYRRLV